jgi:hypothetical protein
MPATPNWCCCLMTRRFIFPLLSLRSLRCERAHPHTLTPATNHRRRPFMRRHITAAVRLTISVSIVIFSRGEPSTIIEALAHPPTLAARFSHTPTHAPSHTRTHPLSSLLKSVAPSVSLHHHSYVLFIASIQPHHAHGYNFILIDQPPTHTTSPHIDTLTRTHCRHFSWLHINDMRAVMHAAHPSLIHPLSTDTFSPPSSPCSTSIPLPLYNTSFMFEALHHK